MFSLSSPLLWTCRLSFYFQIDTTDVQDIDLSRFVPQEVDNTGITVASTERFTSRTQKEKTKADNGKKTGLGFSSWAQLCHLLGYFLQKITNKHKQSTPDAALSSSYLQRSSPTEPVVVPRPTDSQEQRVEGRTKEGKMKKTRRKRRRFQWMKICSREKIWRSSMRNSTHWALKTEGERVRRG